MPANVRRLPVPAQHQTLDPYVRDTPELDELVATRSSVLTHEEILTKQGNVALGNLFDNLQQVYFDTTGRIIDRNAGARNEEHAQLVSEFFHGAIRELQGALVENFRLAEGQIK